MLRERRSNAGQNAALDELHALEEGNIIRRRVRQRVEYNSSRLIARERQIADDILKLNLQRMLGVTTCNHTSDLVLLTTRIDLIKEINSTYYDSLLNNLLPLEVYTNGIILKVNESKEYTVQQESGAILEYITCENILNTNNKYQKVYITIYHYY